MFNDNSSNVNATCGGVKCAHIWDAIHTGNVTEKKKAKKEIRKNKTSKNKN